MHTIESATALAQQILAEHHLDDWRVTIDGAKRRLGICRYDRREIGLSKLHILADDPELVEDTIRHEVAHALAGLQGHRGHGAPWRRMCRTTGANPVRGVASAALNMEARNYRYVARCTGCPRVYNRHRLVGFARLNAKCSLCMTPLVFCDHGVPITK